MEKENTRLKEKIKELEATLSCLHLFPISMIHLGKFFQETLESNARFKGISNLIIATWQFVEENIKKIISLILELWYMEKKLCLSWFENLEHQGRFEYRFEKWWRFLYRWSCDVFYKGFCDDREIEKEKKNPSNN